MGPFCVIDVTRSYFLTVTSPIMWFDSLFPLVSNESEHRGQKNKTVNLISYKTIHLQDILSGLSVFAL